MACAALLALLLSPAAVAARHRRHQPTHHRRHHPTHHRRHHPTHHRRPSGPKVPSLTPGELDPSFGTGGVVTTAFGNWAVAGAAAIQPDGKVVTAGETTVGGKNEFISTRMEPDGALDPTYGLGGIAVPQFAGSSGANAIALEPDGKIILAGASTVGNVQSFAVVRLDPNGSLDQTFGHGGLAAVRIGSASIANAVALQPDGKIVVGGTALDGGLRFAAARLNLDGSIDQTFGSGGVAELGPPAVDWGMSLQRNGDIVLAGETGGQTGLQSLTSLLAPELTIVPGSLLETVTSYGQEYMAARLGPDGRLDPGFGNGGFVTLPIDASAVAFAVSSLANGDTVLAGNAFTNRIVTVLARLLPSGALDGSYGTGGLLTLPLTQGVNAITARRNGETVVAGVGTTVFELTASGVLDHNFGVGGIATASGGAANGVTLAPHNRIVLAGASSIGGRTVLSVTRIGG